MILKKEKTKTNRQVKYRNSKTCKDKNKKESSKKLQETRILKIEMKTPKEVKIDQRMT